MIQKLTTEQQELAAENIRLTTELIKRNVGKSELTYDEIYDSSVEALIRSSRDFNQELGFKFSTLYFVCGNKTIKRKLRDRRAKKRTAITINIDMSDLLPYHEKYSFFDRELIHSTLQNCGLNETEKMCIHLYYYKQLSQSKIAKIMNCSQFQISRLLNRSIGKMRNYIMERW